MPRIPYPLPEQIDEEARKIMAAIPPINVMRMLSHSGSVMAGFGAFGHRILYDLKIDPVLREMAIVRVGHLSRSAYELAQHNRFIADLGVSPEKIAGLGTDIRHPAFTDVEQAVLAFTDDIVANVRASDESLAALRRHFSDRQVVELIMLIGNYRMLCMLLETCGVEIEAPGSVEQPDQKEWERRMSTKNTQGEQE